MTRARSHALVTLTAALAGSVVGGHASAQQSTNDHRDPKACTVLMGGGGTITGDDEADSRWFVVNSTVSRRTLEKLTAANYKMVDYIVNVRDMQKRAAGMYREMEKNGCKKVLQIANELRPPAAGHKEPNLVFVVSVLHVDTSPEERKSRGTFKMAADFEKEYSFVLTTDAMEHLSLSGIGERIAEDVRKSGAL